MMIRVADMAALPEARPHCVKTDGANLILVKQGGSVHALENRCPHLSLPMKRARIEGGEIVCPFHGSRFDLVTGANKDWVSAVAGFRIPAWSSAMLAFGRKPQPMKTYPVTVDDGAVFVELTAR